mgnify:CR=1 FL=1
MLGLLRILARNKNALKALLNLSGKKGDIKFYRALSEPFNPKTMVKKGSIVGGGGPSQLLPKPKMYMEDLMKLEKSGKIPKKSYIRSLMFPYDKLPKQTTWVGSSPFNVLNYSKSGANRKVIGEGSLLEFTVPRSWAKQNLKISTNLQELPKYNNLLHSGFKYNPGAMYSTSGIPYKFLTKATNIDKKTYSSILRNYEKRFGFRKPSSKKIRKEFSLNRKKEVELNKFLKQKFGNKKPSETELSRAKLEFNWDWLARTRMGEFK